MILGYNTNGFAHHRLEDALAIIAELGYGGVALTHDLNHNILNHRTTIADGRLSIVMETGARYILDIRQKHQPTLISNSSFGRYSRFIYLQDAISFCKDFKSLAVSFWSGKPDDEDGHEEWMKRLVEKCRMIADHAAEQDVRLAFEPEPGMFIDTMDKFAELHARVNHPNFGLTLDVGHLVCMNELPISKHIQAWKDWLWNVHLDDMKPGVHDHLMFGEGEVDFVDVFKALKEIDFAGMASVELSRHSYDAVNVATKSMQFLKRFV